MAMLGLRGKSLLALLFACALALIPAALLAWQGINAVREYFGMAYARNHTELNEQKLLAPVVRELALAQRMAGSSLTLAWMRNPSDTAARARFFEEARGYQHDFSDHSYFVVDGTPSYYYNDSKQPAVDTPRYTLRTDQGKDAWFFSTMQDPSPYDLQVDVNHDMGVTKVWFNVQVRDGDRKLGMIGTGLDLSTFLKGFLEGVETGVTPVIFDREGNIQVHPDRSRIALKSMSSDEANRRTALSLVQNAREREALQQAIQEANAQPGRTVSLFATSAGSRSAITLVYLPSLRWYVMTMVDLNVARVVNFQWLTPALVSLLALLALLLLGFGYAVERLVLGPLRRLQHTAQAMSAGRYDVQLPVEGKDEIGELSRAFNVMAEKVRSHTAELENRVRERTKALEEANRQMAATHKTIDDSIDYASLIQRAILPNRQLVHSLGPHHFVLWKPRDVVGGDFYVFRPDGDNCLLGVVDCAGHGVAGALMTMLARAAIDHAISETGPADPSAILARTDAAMRAMLQDAELPRALATNMDAGLVYVDRRAGQLYFAGAKMTLYASDGQEIEEFKGGRRALGEKRVGNYANIALPLAGRTFYLITDGLLDQSGGEHGFGFGNRRLVELLQSVAGLGLDAQARAIAQALDEYQGAQPQRDDITVLSFKFD
ncbi:Methyl-accepting chemotaxis protein PctB [Pigmentiphaga humi]|uniref:Methyl-accepting chemotaxis protein PctB n=1 Tax=Pigmentiphaga humi TaxID=2478468 RepID=A0A3P4B7B3_9BURK|nr:biofilm regulation protein phosphatase SiaA [Pigmentiphaga humi]VCU72179.1 Methyl-accepting chemotaxis protein PctB [Pigmentiphaga humi]